MECTHVFGLPNIVGLVMQLFFAITEYYFFVVIIFYQTVLYLTSVNVYKRSHFWVCFGNLKSYNILYNKYTAVHIVVKYIVKRLHYCAFKKYIQTIYFRILVQPLLVLLPTIILNEYAINGHQPECHVPTHRKHRSAASMNPSQL